MYKSGFIAGTDGNLSVRLGDKWMLTTPSGVHKGTLRPEQIVRCDLSGRPAPREEGKPSSEIRMHLLVYGARPEVKAAVHAHPVNAVALSLVGMSLAECLLPEPALALGPIPTAPYATPTTEDVPGSIAGLLAQKFNALVLARHGTLTLGTTLEEAYLRLETVEHTARITVAARSIGATTALPPAEVARIERVARQLGIARPEATCSQCGACGQRSGEGGGASSEASSQQQSSREVVEQVTSEVMRRLGHGRV